MSISSNGNGSSAEDKHSDVLRAIERARVEVKKKKPLDVIGLAMLEVFEMNNNYVRDATCKVEKISVKVECHETAITEIKEKMKRERTGELIRWGLVFIGLIVTLISGFLGLFNGGKH